MKSFLKLATLDGTVSHLLSFLLPNTCLSLSLSLSFSILFGIKKKKKNKKRIFVLVFAGGVHWLASRLTMFVHTCVRLLIRTCMHASMTDWQAVYLK